MWLCENRLKGKTAHFRLPSAAQKRVCLSSLLSSSHCRRHHHLRRHHHHRPNRRRHHRRRRHHLRRRHHHLRHHHHRRRHHHCRRHHHRPNRRRYHRRRHHHRPNRCRHHYHHPILSHTRPLGPRRFRGEVVIVRIGILHTGLKPHHPYTLGPFMRTISPHSLSRPTVSISIVIAYVTNSVSIAVSLIAVRNPRAVVTSVSHEILVFIGLVSIGNSRAIILKTNKHTNKTKTQKIRSHISTCKVYFI